MPSNIEMAAIKVREALLYMAPDDDAKRDILRVYEEVFKEAEEQGHIKDVLRAMTCAMADGVLYGNWPWVINKLNK